MTSVDLDALMSLDGAAPAAESKKRKAEDQDVVGTVSCADEAVQSAIVNKDFDARPRLIKKRRLDGGGSGSGSSGSAADVTGLTLAPTTVFLKLAPRVTTRRKRSSQVVKVKEDAAAGKDAKSAAEKENEHDDQGLDEEESQDEEEGEVEEEDDKEAKATAARERRNQRRREQRQRKKLESLAVVNGDTGGDDADEQDTTESKVPRRRHRSLGESASSSRSSRATSLAYWRRVGGGYGKLTVEDAVAIQKVVRTRIMPWLRQHHMDVDRYGLLDSLHLPGFLDKDLADLHLKQLVDGPEFRWMYPDDPYAPLTRAGKELSRTKGCLLAETDSVAGSGKRDMVPYYGNYTGAVPMHVKFSRPFTEDGAKVSWMLNELIESVTGQRGNHAIGTMYVDGDSAIPWHSDKYDDLDPQSFVVSASYGATCPLEFRLKSSKTFDLELLDQCRAVLKQYREEHRVERHEEMELNKAKQSERLQQQKEKRESKVKAAAAKLARKSAEGKESKAEGDADETESDDDEDEDEDEDEDDAAALPNYDEIEELEAEADAEEEKMLAHLPDKFAVELEHGDVFIMGRITNEFYEHSIQPSKSERETRISVILRKVATVIPETLLESMHLETRTEKQAAKESKKAAAAAVDKTTPKEKDKEESTKAASDDEDNKDDDADGAPDDDASGDEGYVSAGAINDKGGSSCTSDV